MASAFSRFSRISTFCACPRLAGCPTLPRALPELRNVTPGLFTFSGRSPGEAACSQFSSLSWRRGVAGQQKPCAAFSGSADVDLPEMGPSKTSAGETLKAVEWNDQLANVVILSGLVAGWAKPTKMGFSFGLKYERQGKDAIMEDWYMVSCEGELAEAAKTGMRLGMLVHVHGTLEQNKPFEKDGVFRNSVVIRARELFRVKDAILEGEGAPVEEEDMGGNRDAEQNWEPPRQAATNSYSSSAPQGGKRSAEDLWSEYFTYPERFWDNRENKKTGRHPDFVNKNTREGLWVNNSTPKWVQDKLLQ